MTIALLAVLAGDLKVNHPLETKFCHSPFGAITTKIIFLPTNALVCVVLAYANGT